MLRGIASLSVLFAHESHKLYQNGIFSSDWLTFAGWGVDIFFMISGFIMMMISKKEINKTKFIVDRLIRIIPLYWLFTLIALILYVCVPSIVNTSGGHTGIFQSFILVPIPAGTKFLVQNGWTLSYEFLFYICFLFALKFKDVNKLLFVSATFLLIDLYLFWIQTSNFLSSSIKYEFILGGSIYLFFYRSKLLALTLLVILLSILLSIFDLGSRALSLFSLLSFILVFSLINFESYFSANSSKLIQWLFILGEISYSLYLVHPFTIQFTQLILKKLNVLSACSFMILATILSLIAGFVCYKWIEVPMTRYLKSKLNWEKAFFLTSKNTDKKLMNYKDNHKFFSK